MKKKPKYKFFTDGVHRIIAVSSYAGRTVKGVARCNPEDTFDMALGKKIAEARCAKKIAEKRYKRATEKYEEAVRLEHDAMKRFNKMCKYLKDAYEAKEQADMELSELYVNIHNSSIDN